MVAISSCFPIVLGRTFRLVNESGGNFPCAGSAVAKAADMTKRPMIWRIDLNPSFRSSNAIMVNRSACSWFAGKGCEEVNQQRQNVGFVKEAEQSRQAFQDGGWTTKL